MRGPVPRIHVLDPAARTWMAAPSLDKPGHDEFWFYPTQKPL
jgi:hypothetical protein